MVGPRNRRGGSPGWQTGTSLNSSGERLPGELRLSFESYKTYKKAVEDGKESLMYFYSIFSAERVFQSLCLLMVTYSIYPM